MDVFEMNNLRHFVLLKRLEPGETSSGRLLVWDGQQYVEGPTVTIYDYLGHYGFPGDRGSCVLSEESGNWEVVYGLNRRATELSM